MNTKVTLLLLLFSSAFIVFSCEKDPNKPDLSDETLILNKWIWEGMNDVYLWENQIPDLDPEYQEDSEEYFYDLLYSADSYSWIVDDYEKLVAMFAGVSLSTGMSVSPGRFDDTKVISIVEYVSPGSPAADSGIERGDIIIAIDGQSLNADNYHDLYYQTTATFEFADWDGTQFILSDKIITLTAIELSQNPIVHQEVIDYLGKKVGYMVYTQFTAGQDGEWIEELNTVFEGFINSGISDVVIDLRYNPGGSLDLSAYMASSLGPRSTMENEEVFVNLVWNDKYNEFWKDFDWDEDGKADGENSVQLVIRMPESNVNLDMSTIYFLTTEGTASASESLMTGLYPYANVVQIGTTSYGKCYGSITIDDSDPKRHNWAMQPIVLKYSNSEGFTDFVNGIDPDFLVEEYLLNAEPFGSVKDPMLATALGEITGVYPTQKSLRISDHNFESLPAPPNRMVERNITWPDR
ncbi:MAG: hypothetical protein GY790_18400 [Bacteroidetes bacterium]|nr:hypothetical protein [Bacteroidota bacterium]